ncbi:MAG: DUF1849 family protein, partial [Pseudomonadota bacterium]
QIALYDATYTVVADSGAGSASQPGHIRQSLTQDCREWLYFQNAEFSAPGEQLMNWETTTREAMDATQFHFDMTVRGDEEVSRLQGSAVMNAYSGRAIFEDENRTILRIEPETLFPTQFLAELIDRAEAGERYFSVPVFSGIDGQRVLRVTAVIGNPFDAPEVGSTSSLLAHMGWPITLAYFDSESGGGLEYQVEVDLLENGIARSMDIQNDDYRLSVRLSEIEAVVPNGC